MSLKIIIARKHTCSHKLLLEYPHKIQQTLRSAVSYIVQCIRRLRKPVLPDLSLRRLLHDSDNSFDNIIYICKVPLAVPVIEYLYLFSLDKLLRKLEICHIRTSRRTIDRKESQTSARNIIKLAVRMSHQFVALLGRSIERNRRIHLVISRIWNL